MTKYRSGIVLNLIAGTAGYGSIPFSIKKPFRWGRGDHAICPVTIFSLRLMAKVVGYTVE